MDNIDVAASPKVHGHALTHTNEKEKFELLTWHGLDEQSLAIFSWRKVVSWIVIAEQFKLGKAIPRDFCTHSSRLETDCRHFSTWSVLEIPGMNECSGSSFLPQGYHLNSLCNSSLIWEEVTLLCHRSHCLWALGRPCPWHIHPGAWDKLSIFYCRKQEKLLVSFHKLQWNNTSKETNYEMDLLLFVLQLSLRPKWTSCSLSLIKVARDGGTWGCIDPVLWRCTAI